MRILAFIGEGIGNVILATPMIQAVQQMYPLVWVDAICKYPEILHGLPFTNPVQGQKFAKSYYDICFTNIFDYPAYYSEVTIGDNWPRPRLRYDEHEIVQNMEPIREKGFDGETPRQHAPMMDLPRLFPSDRPVVGICDGSKPRSTCGTDEEYHAWAKKRWPHFPEFCKLLLEEGAVVAVFGTSEDGPDLDVETLNHPYLFDVRGQFKLRELGGILQQCSVFISTDTGPMHVADAAGIRLYAIFGPTSILKNQPACMTSHVIDAKEIYGIEEPEQGTREFAETIRSPSLEALTAEKVREIIEQI